MKNHILSGLLFFIFSVGIAQNPRKLFTTQNNILGSASTGIIGLDNNDFIVAEDSAVYWVNNKLELSACNFLSDTNYVITLTENGLSNSTTKDLLLLRAMDKKSSKWIGKNIEANESCSTSEINFVTLDGEFLYETFLIGDTIVGRYNSDIVKVVNGQIVWRLNEIISEDIETTSILGYQGSNVYFTINNALWCTDFTKAGTKVVKEFSGNNRKDYFYDFTVMDDGFFVTHCWDEDLTQNGDYFFHSVEILFYENTTNSLNTIHKMDVPMGTESPFRLHIFVSVAGPWLIYRELVIESNRVVTIFSAYNLEEKNYYNLMTSKCSDINQPMSVSVLDSSIFLSNCTSIIKLTNGIDEVIPTEVITTTTGRFGEIEQLSEKYFAYCKSDSEDSLWLYDMVIEKAVFVDNGNFRSFGLGAINQDGAYIYPKRISSQAHFEFWVFDAGLLSGFDEKSISFSCDIYPNPASREINVVTHNSKTYSVVIQNIEGKKLFSTDMSSHLTIDVGDYVPGLYLIAITGADTYYTKKIILTGN